MEAEEKGRVFDLEFECELVLEVEGVEVGSDLFGSKEIAGGEFFGGRCFIICPFGILLTSASCTCMIGCV